MSTTQILVSPDYVRDWILAVTKPTEFLFVDDDSNERLLFEKFSRGWNCHFDFANGIEEAAKFVSLKRYKLIFLDIRFPGYNGVDIFKRIKEINSDIKVAVISGNITPDIIRSFQLVGFTIFISKPQAFTHDFFDALYGILNVTRIPVKTESE